MRKTLLLLFALALVNLSFAQFNKGRMLAGGSVGFSSITEKTKSGPTTTTIGTQTTLSFAPSFGYFVIDNLAVGASVYYNNITFKYDGGGKDKSNEFTFAPFARYYFGPGIFGQGSFGLGSGKDVPVTGNTTTYGITLWSLGVGYAYFLNDNVAIEPLIKYQGQTDKYDGTGSPKDINNGIAFSIGVQAYLGKRSGK